MGDARRMRAIWSNPGFVAHLRAAGLSDALLRTDYVTDWFKSDPTRLVGTGFTTNDDLTCDHVVPKELGGVDSKYNYHLMLRSDNSRFAHYFTPEKVELVGALNCKVAQRVVQLARRQGLDRYDESAFDPSAVACPAPVRKRSLDADLETASESDHDADVSPPTNVPELLLAIAQRDLGVLRGPVPSHIAKPGIEALRRACEEYGVPVPDVASKANYRRRDRVYPPLPDGLWIVRAPPQAEWPQSSILSTYLHQVSFQTRMGVCAEGDPIGIVPFKHGALSYAILTSEQALRARRAVAAAAAADAASLRAFLALRERRPSQPNWEMLQGVLFSSGLAVCPTSGSPVFNIDECPPRLRTALWDVLAALQRVVNEKTPEANEAFESALRVLAPMVERRAVE